MKKTKLWFVVLLSCILFCGCGEGGSISAGSAETTTADEEVETSETDLANKVIGTYVGENGSGLTLFPDGDVRYYWREWDEVDASGTWELSDDEIMWKCSIIDTDLYAVIYGEDTSELLFKARSGSGWDDEVFQKVANSPDVLTVEEYQRIIESTIGMEIKKDPWDLEGSWEQVDVEDDMNHYYAGYIQDGYIRLYHVANGGFARSLYWCGTYQKNEEGLEEYEWESMNKTDETESIFLCSHDEKKDFSSDGESISFSGVHASQPVEVRLKRSKVDYSKEPSIPNAEQQISFGGMEFILSGKWGVSSIDERMAVYFTEECSLILQELKDSDFTQDMFMGDAAINSYYSSMIQEFKPLTQEEPMQRITVAGYPAVNKTLSGNYSNVAGTMHTVLIYNNDTDVIVSAIMYYSDQTRGYDTEFQSILESAVKEGISDAISQNNIEIQVTEKENLKENWQAGRYSPRVNFTFRVVNGKDKDVKGVQGILTIRDLFGKTIKRLNCDFTGTTIPGRDTAIFVKGFDVNEFMDEDVKVYNENYDDLQFEYSVTAIVFTDGSLE